LPDQLALDRGKHAHMSMNILWLAIAAGIAAALAKRVLWPHGRGSPADLGFVSRQWVAEHRQSQTTEPPR